METITISRNRTSLMSPEVHHAPINLNCLPPWKSDPPLPPLTRALFSGFLYSASLECAFLDV